MILMHDYKLVWDDNFNYTGLPDNSKWEFDEGGNGWGNNERQYYTINRINNAEVRNNKLAIKSIYENYLNNSFTSAKLISKESWKYGIFEIKAKLPLARGSWPAIWMLPYNYNEYSEWPYCGEIDIVEHFGHTLGEIQFSLQTYYYNFRSDNRFNKKINIGDKIYNSNTYLMKWTESYIEFFFNDVSVFKALKTQCNSTNKLHWPFDIPFNLIINVAVGGNHAGKYGVDINSWPQIFEIEYVKVYQLK